VANADPQELLPILMQAQPNKVRLGTKDEQKLKEKLLAKAKAISESANRLWRKSLLLLLLAFPVKWFTNCGWVTEPEMQQDIYDGEE
jgi:hypothetical protein